MPIGEEAVSPLDDVRTLSLLRLVGERQDRKRLRRSDLFDEDRYRSLYPDVADAGVDPITHYLRFGAAEGRRPSDAFDGKLYLQQNPDVRRAGANPLLHYLKHGASERRPLPAAETEEAGTPVAELARSLNRSAERAHLPRVLILPAIFAVGGAERNVIAVMRPLADRFRFVVVTNEKHTAARGCLLGEIADDCEAVFDLADLAPRSEHLDIFSAICTAFPPDLVWVTNGSIWFHQNVDALMALFDGIPVVDQQAYDHEAGWIEHLTPGYCARAARLIAINTRIEREFIDRLGATGKTDLIHHAIDLDRLPPLPVVSRSRNEGHGTGGSTTRKTVVFIGRLADQKRPLDLIEVARIADASGLPVDFVMVGEGPLLEACASEIESANLRNVALRPFAEEVAEIYEMADALILVSAYEGLPIVMLEALASGVPVLATDVGDIRRVAEELGGGCVVVDGAIGCPQRMAGALTDFVGALDGHRHAALQVAPKVRDRFGDTRVAEDYFDCWSAAWQACADRDLA